MVVPLKFHGDNDDRPVKGEKLFPEAYGNIFLCAKKKSGKTVVISKIIKECCGKNTKVVAFVSTIHKDPSWIAIKRWCDKHSIPFEGYQDIFEDGEDVLQGFLDDIGQEGPEEDIDDDKLEDDKHNTWDDRRISHSKNLQKKPLKLFPSNKKRDYDSAESDESSADDESEGMFGKGHEYSGKISFAKKHQSLMKRDKFKAPEYLFIFDDLSHELKCPTLVSLMKKNRHYLCKIVISSQGLHDLKPEQHKQLDTLILFKSISDDKLKKIVADCDLSIDLDNFNKIYHNATKEPFNFLYVDCRSDQYRKNFSHLYMINQPSSESIRSKEIEEDKNNDDSE
jgi:hypothetical protein